jgi:hypothetical protein
LDGASGGTFVKVTSSAFAGYHGSNVIKMGDGTMTVHACPKRHPRTTPDSQGYVTGNAWGKWNLHRFLSQLNFQGCFKRPRSKLDENDSAAVFSGLNPQDMGLIGLANKRADGIGRLALNCPVRSAARVS